MFEKQLSLLVAFLFLSNTALWANPGYGSREKKACIHCHNQVSGGGGLNGTGNKYLKDGHKFPDPKKKKKEEESAPPTKTTTPEATQPVTETTEKYRPETAAEKKEREARLAAIDAAVAAEEKKKALRKYKRFVAKGKKLFSSVHDKLTSNGKTCLDCHEKSKLAKAKRKYPRWHKGLNRVVSYDRMIRLCIYHRMKGSPLEAESAYTLSLAAYLKEVAAGHVK